MSNDDELEDLERDEVDDWIASDDLPGKKVPIVISLLFLGSLVGVLIVVLQYSSPDQFHDSDGDGVEDSRDVLPDGDAWVTFNVSWSCECELFGVTLSYEPLNFNEQSLLDRAVISNDTGGADTRLVDWPDGDEHLNMSVIIQGSGQHDFSIYYWGGWTMPDNSFGLNYTVTVIR